MTPEPEVRVRMPVTDDRHSANLLRRLQARIPSAGHRHSRSRPNPARPHARP